MSTAPATIAVRRPKPVDAQPVADIHAAAWREAYLGILPGPTLEAMIARRGSVKWAAAFARSTGFRILDVGGQCAGYASFGPARSRVTPMSAEIFELYLAPEYQGLGLGCKLFLQTRAAAERAYGKGLIVWALSANERAAGFYRHLGGRSGPRSTEKIGEAVYDKCSWVWP